MYGTIRMHQEREYPGRVVAHRAAQSGFRRLCARLRRLRRDGGEDRAISPRRSTQRQASGKPAIIHLKIDPEAITPATTLDAIRAKALAAKTLTAWIALAAVVKLGSLPSEFDSLHALSPHRERRPPPGGAAATRSWPRRGALAREGGMAAVQIAPVAARAGIATGTVYRYFPSKTDLVAALVAAVSEREIGAMRRAANAAPGPLSALAAAITTFAARALASRGWPLR